MKALFRAVAVLFVLVAAVLVYAVVAALGSDEGARIGVVAIYVIVSAALGYGAFALWRRSKVPAGA